MAGQSRCTRLEHLNGFEAFESMDPEIGEDDVLLREGIARLLTEAGFDVVAQAGGVNRAKFRDDRLYRS